MRYKISKLSKAGIAKEVTVIVADRFEVGKATGNRGIFSDAFGIAFYVDKNHWYASAEALTAFLPGTDWIVETI
jgi:hypothetical protein